MTPREARYAGSLRRGGAIMAVVSVVLLLIAHLEQVGAGGTCGDGDDVCALLDAVAGVFLAVAGTRVEEWAKVTLVDETQWLTFQRDPGWVSDFGYFLDGPGRGQAWGLFRVRARELSRVLHAWGIPDTLVSPSGHRHPGEEALLAFLARVATNITWQNMELMLNRRFQDVSPPIPPPRASPPPLHLPRM